MLTPSVVVFWRHSVLGLAMGGLVSAAEPVDSATAALEQIRTANQVRREIAREAAAWTQERQRLEALIAATKADTARSERDALAAENARDAARQRVAALAGSSDLEALRARLAQAGVRWNAVLAQLAATLPPGVVPQARAEDDAFDAGVKALDAAERAAGGVAVEVVTGTRDGQPAAVKMLRIAGAAAWWVALDGSAAGTVTVKNGALELQVVPGESERLAIAAALAQAEGRSGPTVVLLPGVRP